MRNTKPYIEPKQAESIAGNIVGVKDFDGLVKVLDGTEVAFMPNGDIGLNDLVATEFSTRLTKAIVAGGNTNDILQEIDKARNEKQDLVALSVCLRAIDKMKSRGVTNGKFSLDVSTGAIARVVLAPSSTRTVSKNGIDVSFGKEVVGSYANGNDACKANNIDAKGNSIKALKDKGYLVTTRTEPIPV